MGLTQVLLSPTNKTCNGFTCQCSHWEVSQHTLNVTCDRKTIFPLVNYTAVFQTLHLIDMLLACTGWLCFVPSLPTFTEHLSRTEHCTGSWT